MPLRRITVFLGVAGIAALLSLSVPPLFGQQRPSSAQQFPASYRAPRLDGHPDLNGIWQALVTANWDLQDHEAQPGPHPELTGAYGAGPAGQSIVEGGEIPYKPEALAKRKANFENRLKVDVSDDKTWHALGDPEMKCYMPGVPRATYMPFPFQIVQGTSPYILMAYEFTSATRIIRMNWEQAAPTDSWMGWSRGRWEGDTLVVDVVGFNEGSWIDMVGDPHTDRLHLVERFTRKDHYTLRYEATIDDPGAYTEPWTIGFDIVWDEKGEIQEYICQENSPWMRKFFAEWDRARR